MIIINLWKMQPLKNPECEILRIWITLENRRLSEKNVLQIITQNLSSRLKMWNVQLVLLIFWGYSVLAFFVKFCSCQRILVLPDHFVSSRRFYWYTYFLIWLICFMSYDICHEHHKPSFYDVLWRFMTSAKYKVLLNMTILVSN